MFSAARFARASLVVALIPSTVACGVVVDATPKEDSPAARAILGTGALRFEPLSDGDRAPIVTGPQGGHHIWGSVRVRALDVNGALQVRFTLTRGDGQLLNVVNTELRATPIPPAEAAEPDAEALPGGADMWREALGATVYVPIACAAWDSPVLMHVEVRDPAGKTCSDERTIVPTYDRWRTCVPAWSTPIPTGIGD